MNRVHMRCDMKTQGKINLKRKSKHGIFNERPRLPEWKHMKSVKWLRNQHCIFEAFYRTIKVRS